MNEYEELINQLDKEHFLKCQLSKLEFTSGNRYTFSSVLKSGVSIVIEARNIQEIMETLPPKLKSRIT